MAGTYPARLATATRLAVTNPSRRRDVTEFPADPAIATIRSPTVTPAHRPFKAAESGSAPFTIWLAQPSGTPVTARHRPVTAPQRWPKRCLTPLRPARASRQRDGDRDEPIRTRRPGHAAHA